MESKVKKAFDKIKKTSWVVDEGRWRHYELVYDEKWDAIILEVTNIAGDLVDSDDVTHEYLEEE